ncbi:MAG TPA: FAD-dependent monooxygenase [Stellaceae bacterium]
MARRPKVAIVGAGLGGLAAAAALTQRGFEVAVYERAAELGEIGAGIALSPNVLRTLRYLGLDEAVLADAFRPRDHVFRSWKSGRSLLQARVQGTYEQFFGAPMCNIHRADLHRILREAVPAAAIHLKAEAVGTEQTADGAAIHFRDGTSVEADIVVGADGIRSNIRQNLFGADTPDFTGNVAWRFTVPTDALPEGFIRPAVSNWLGPGGHVVHYYVRRGQLVNVVAIHETAEWTEESWALRGDKRDLMTAFAGWNEALFQLFDKADLCFKWGLFDHAPLATWRVGRVALLGDAAHAMLPFLGQGAAMAIEDGAALAYLLADCPDEPTLALRRYQDMRLPRTRRAQLGSRARAAENHLKSPTARLRRDAGFRLRQWLRPNGTLHRAEWLYRYDVRAECAAMRRDAGGDD